MMAIWQERAPKCNCESGEVVIYFCDVNGCPANRRQQAYCQRCMEKGKHSHFPLKYILDVLKDEEALWTTITEKTNRITFATQPKYQRLRALILYIESKDREGILQAAGGLISADYQKLLAFQQDLLNFQQTVETHIQRGQLLELMTLRGRH